MLLYRPYKSDKPGKNVYFDQASASDFAHYKDEQRK